MWSYDPFVSTRNLLEKSIESLETQLICIQNPHVPIHHYFSKNHTQGTKKIITQTLLGGLCLRSERKLIPKKNRRREFFLAADGQTLANSLGWWKTVVFFGKYLQLSTGDSKVSPIKNSSEKMSYSHTHVRRNQQSCHIPPKTKKAFSGSSQLKIWVCITFLGEEDEMKKMNPPFFVRTWLDEVVSKQPHCASLRFLLCKDETWYAAPWTEQFRFSRSTWFPFCGWWLVFVQNGGQLSGALGNLGFVSF